MIISLSLRLSPQLLIIITSEELSFGEIFFAIANACAGSRLGEMSSSSVTNLKASNASSSVA